MRPFLILLLIMGYLVSSGQHSTEWTVSQDGTGKYSSVQAALDAVPEGNSHPITIHIKKGIYREKVVVDSRKRFVKLKGEGADKTIITFNDHAGTLLPNGDTLNTWTCASFLVYADDFQAEKICFENNAGFTAGQAVALRVEGNRASFINCSMKGFQDVLFLSGSGVKHYFRDCYIEGTTDFIFGAATAVFKNCHIHSKKNSHVTAASTNSIIPFGFVFFDCRLTSDSLVKKVSLGRPWSPTASVTYIRCYMDDHIIPEGWNNWRNEANEKTARYAEYNSTGPGGNSSSRVKWAKQLSEKEVAVFSMENIFGNWKPEERTGQYHFVVAPDGSGDFTTVQEAINAVPDMRKKRTVIFIKKGVYREKIVIPETKPMLTLIGEDVNEVVLTYDDYASKKNIFGEEMGTSGTASFYLNAKDFIAENITFQNSSGAVGQAVAAWIGGDRIIFRNCRFLGFQDTLYTYGTGSRQYYSGCYIEGTVDFIFGSSTAVFDSCRIQARTNSYITAASTPEGMAFGYVFRYCTISGNAASPGYYLGRPWRPFARTVFLYCYMDSLIRPEGWHNWNKPDAEKTSFYAEYGNRGPGAATNRRVPWSHILTKQEADNYQPQRVFGDWIYTSPKMND
ncbi:MAG: pectinesterase family protein [Chitinophagaceae bacterium]